MILVRIKWHLQLNSKDNHGCLAFVQTERSTRRSKHINTREKYARELCDKKEIVLVYCPTDMMIADALTKPLGPQKHGQFCEMLRLEKSK